MKWNRIEQNRIEQNRENYRILSEIIKHKQTNTKPILQACFTYTFVLFELCPKRKFIKRRQKAYIYSALKQ